jgi:hypothetical protein
MVPPARLWIWRFQGLASKTSGSQHRTDAEQQWRTGGTQGAQLVSRTMVSCVERFYDRRACMKIQTASCELPMMAGPRSQPNVRPEPPPSPRLWASRALTKERPSQEKVRKLTPSAAGAPFWARVPGCARRERGASPAHWPILVVSAFPLSTTRRETVASYWHVLRLARNSSETESATLILRERLPHDTRFGNTPNLFPILHADPLSCKTEGWVIESHPPAFSGPLS